MSDSSSTIAYLVVGEDRRVVTVAYANAKALAFYQRFGFQPRSISLAQTPDHGA
jgi:ribosomal protein S18 acetylase RimI-like enzyme